MLDHIIDKDGNIRLSSLIPPAFRHGFFLNFKGRYRVFKGARNTGKSHTMIGWESIIKILSDPRRNIAIIRMNANSNRQSTFENICGRIYDFGLERLFRMTSNPSPEIEYKPTGQKIVFKGMNDPTTLNSMTFAKGYLTDVYIEEAFEIESYSDFRKLDGSLRGKLPDGLFMQITLCFNAWRKDHWIYDTFFRGNFEDDYGYLDRPDVAFDEWYDLSWQGDYGRGLYLNTSTYKANVFRDAETTDPAAAKMRERSPDIYKVEYLGMWGNATAGTYPEFTDSCVLPLSEIKRKYRFISYAIGVDTGLSNGEGGRRTISRTQTVEERVKSAHAVMLVGITDDYENIVVLDEYYHTEIERNGEYNTDEPGTIGEPELLRRTLRYVLDWEKFYGNERLGILDGGESQVYVDSADVGFRQMLQKEFEMHNRFDFRCFQSSKLSVQSRVDFEKIMMAWGNFIVCDRCKNAIREFRNARRDPKGRARMDGDDHALTALEYAFTPLLGDVHRWKQFKERN